MKRYFMLLTTGLALACSGAHAQRIRQLGANPEALEDLTLPKGVVVLDAQMLHSRYERGSSFSTGAAKNKDNLRFYEERYGADMAVLETLSHDDSAVLNRYKLLTDSLKLSVIPVRDNSKRFAFDKFGRWNADQTLTISYGPDGVVSGVAYSSQDKTVDIVLKGISGVAGIASAVFRGGAGLVEIQIDSIPELEVILAELKELYQPGVASNNIDIYKDIKSHLLEKYQEAFARHLYSTKKTIRPVQITYTPADTNKPAPGTTLSLPVFRFDKANGRFFRNSDPLFSSSRPDLVHKAAPEALGWYTLVLEMAPAAEQPFTYLAPRDPARKESRNAFPVNACARAWVALKAPDGEMKPSLPARIPQYGILTYERPRRLNKRSYQYDEFGELKGRTLERTSAVSEQVAAAGGVAKEIVLLPQLNETEGLKKEVERLKLQKERDELLRAAVPDDQP